MDADGSDDKKGITFLQWNVLADALAQSGGFVKCPPEALEWPARFPKIVAEIQRSKADIVALQECNHIDDFSGVFSTDYYLFWVPKMTSPAVKEDPRVPPDGTAVFVRRGRFEICGVQTLFYSASEGAALANQSAIVLLLRERSDPSRFLIVATTHLKAKDGESNAKERKAQMEQLLAAIEVMKASNASKIGASSAVSVLISGDFNSPPEEPVHGLVSGAGFSSVYNSSPETSPPEGEPSFTTFKFRSAEVGVATPASPVVDVDAPLLHKKRTIDYIWLSNSTSTSTKATTGLKVVATRALPTVEEVGAEGLPSAAYPSDHLSLCARFSWA